MRAFRYLGPKKADLVDVDRPQVADDEVLIKVVANGLCHSDVVFIDQLPGIPDGQQRTLGHEVAGTIEELGSSVQGFRIGEAVAVYQVLSCGTCRQCRSGASNLCRNEFGAIGMTFDGGLAEYVAVPASLVVPIGDLDPVQAAVLTDSGLTAYGAIGHATDLLVPGTTAMVIGIGGLGHVALQILRAITPARVIAVDIDEAKLDLARRVGAHETVMAGPSAADDVFGIVGKAGVDAVFDFAANESSIALGAATTGVGGSILLTGLGFGALTVSTGFGGMTKPEVRVVRTMAGTRLQLDDCFALARQGLITVEATSYGLEETSEALAALERGEVVGRAVILPNGS